MTMEEWTSVADAAMSRYARGNDSAFSELYDALAPRLFTFALRRLRDDARAEDLVQQTFLKMHAARRHFIPGAAVMPWSFSIARHLLIDRMRAEQRERMVGRDDAREAAELPCMRDLPDHAANVRGLTRRLEQELAELPEAHRAAFELVQLDGLSMAEAAEVLGTTALTVKARAHRAYQALRKRLGAEVLEAL